MKELLYFIYSSQCCHKLACICTRRQLQQEYFTQPMLCSHQITCFLLSYSVSAPLWLQLSASLVFGGVSGLLKVCPWLDVISLSVSLWSLRYYIDKFPFCLKDRLNDLLALLFFYQQDFWCLCLKGMHRQIHVVLCLIGSKLSVSYWHYFWLYSIFPSCDLK